MGIKLYPNFIADDDGTPIADEVLAPDGHQTAGVNLLPFGGMLCPSASQHTIVSYATH